MTTKEIVKSEKIEQESLQWDHAKKDKVVIYNRVKTMLVNGNRLNDDEVNALVAYSLTNDLNPFNGECYMMPGIGCAPGIAGWRKKAIEQLLIEAVEAGIRGGHFVITYEHATHDEACFSEDNGDVAWKATLTDTVSESRWLANVLESAKEIRVVFPEIDFRTAMNESKDISGVKPEWWAVGVVSGSEKFSKEIWAKDASGQGAKKPTGEYKPEMWDRNERAKKRAAKGAIRMRFSGLTLPTHLLNGRSTIDSQFIDEGDLTISHVQEVVDVQAPEDVSQEPEIIPSELTENGSLINSLVDSGYATDDQDAIAILELCPLPDRATAAVIIEWVRIYQSELDETAAGDEISQSDAVDAANQWYEDKIKEELGY